MCSRDSSPRQNPSPPPFLKSREQHPPCPRPQPESARAPPATGAAQYPHRPTEWARISQASPFFHGARQPRWPRAAPTPPASGSRAQRVRASLVPSIQNGSVCINAPIPQERPIAAHLFDALRIALSQQNFFLVRGSLGQNLPEGIANERMPPEFEPAFGRAF